MRLILRHSSHIKRLLGVFFGWSSSLVCGLTEWEACLLMNRLQRTLKFQRLKLCAPSSFIIDFFNAKLKLFRKKLVSILSDINSCAFNSGRKYFNTIIAERISECLSVKRVSFWLPLFCLIHCVCNEQLSQHSTVWEFWSRNQDELFCPFSSSITRLQQLTQAADWKLSTLFYN